MRIYCGYQCVIFLSTNNWYNFTCYLWQRVYSQVELVSDERVFEGFELDVWLWVFVDFKFRDVRLKGFIQFGDNGIPHSSNACSLPQLTFLLKENTREAHFDHSYSVPFCRSPTHISCANGQNIQQEHQQHRVNKTADLFDGNFDFLELCFSAQYWPRDVQPNKPYAIWPLHINRVQ